MAWFGVKPNSMLVTLSAAWLNPHAHAFATSRYKARVYKVCEHNGSQRFPFARCPTSGKCQSMTCDVDLRPICEAAEIHPCELPCLWQL
eukprot:5643073-Amphidinium_carterae.1